MSTTPDARALALAPHALPRPARRRPTTRSSTTASTGSSSRAADDGCTFTYEDDDVQIVKTITAGDAARSSSNVETTVTNLTDAPKKHTALDRVVRVPHEQGDQGQPRPRVAVPDGALVRARQGRRSARARSDEFKAGWFASRSSIATPRSPTTTSRRRSCRRHGRGRGRPKPSCELLAEEWYGGAQKRRRRRRRRRLPRALIYPPRDARAERDRDVHADRLLRPEGARHPREGRGRHRRASATSSTSASSRPSRRSSCGSSR